MMTAYPGNGHSMRETFLREWLGPVTEEYRKIGDGPD